MAGRPKMEGSRNRRYAERLAQEGIVKVGVLVPSDQRETILRIAAELRERAPPTPQEVRRD